TKAFGVRANGELEGLVTGLKNGPNVLTARLPDGYGAYITITNHPIGGPVFAGPQIQPWKCQNAGAKDAQCDQPPSYQFYYLPKGAPEQGAALPGTSSNGGGPSSFQPYD